ncbi:putative ankyrin repeat protein [Zopfochytrium polystomum]|nr:putative ankyrin repeat protein [Zopfochytrium polystomum]
MDGASANGYTAALEWWKESGLELRYEWAMSCASGRGHLDVLQWWRDSGLPLKYKSAMNSASLYARVEVLQWWKESGLDLTHAYTDKALMYASTVGCDFHLTGDRKSVPVLQWWKDSGLPLKVSAEGVQWARSHGSEDVVDWWEVLVLGLLV